MHCPACGDRAEPDARCCNSCGSQLPVHQPNVTSPPPGASTPPPRAPTPPLRRSPSPAAAPGLSPQERSHNRRVGLKVTWVTVTVGVVLSTATGASGLGAALLAWLMLGGIATVVVLAATHERL